MTSISKSFLFVHVPKTGGNSLQNILSEYSEDEIIVTGEHQDGVERFGVKNQNNDTVKHSTLSAYKSAMDEKSYSGLTKFATIRNPWDKMISFYFHRHRGAADWDREAFKDLLGEVEPLRHYVYVPTFLERVRKKLGLPVKYGKLTRDIDCLLRFEHLQSDFDGLCNKLEIPRHELPHRNATVREHYSKYYDEELVELVRARFSEEIEFGKYTFEQV